MEELTRGDERMAMARGLGPMASNATVRMARFQDVLWTVQARAGGREFRFLFDLGAGVTCVDESVRAANGAEPTRSVAGRRATGELLELPLIEPLAFSFADAPLQFGAVGVLDLRSLLPASWPRIDGVLALDALAETPIRVDFSRNVLEIGTLGDVSSMREVRIQPVRQLDGVSLVVSVAVGSPTGTLWFELDNSSTGPVALSEATATRLGLPRSAREAVLDVIGIGPIHSPVVVRDVIYDGVLGRTFVEGRIVALDLVRSRAWISDAPR